MIIIGSEWHAYFSVYAQFGSNLSIYVFICRCKANLYRNQAFRFYFRICLMDVPIHVHNGNGADANARTPFFSLPSLCPNCARIRTCDSIYCDLLFISCVHSTASHQLPGRWNGCVFFLSSFDGRPCTLIMRNVLSENGQLNWVIITLIGRIKKSLTFPFYQMLSLCIAAMLLLFHFCRVHAFHFFFSCHRNFEHFSNGILDGAYEWPVLWETHFISDGVCVHDEPHILLEFNSSLLCWCFCFFSHPHNFASLFAHSVHRS